MYENFKIVHRVLKPENIIITTKIWVIIIALGVAQTIDSTMKSFYSIIWTPALAVIDILYEENTNIKNQKTDMKPFKCILHFFVREKIHF